MKYDKRKEMVIFDESELNILILAVVELGGPFHSQFAERLNRLHSIDYKRILKNLYKKEGIALEDLSLLIDITSLLLEETPSSDFGTYYEDVKEKDVKALYEKLERLYKEIARDQ